MPKFGLKCFIGSFIFSLIAIFIVMQWQGVFSGEEKLPPLTLSENEIHNIELFAATEETDPLYEKFIDLQKRDLSVTSEDETESAGEEKSETVVANGSTEILYFPEDITEDETAIYSSQATLDEFQDEESFGTSENIRTDERENEQSQKGKNFEEELKIVDASLAPEFTIPLIHNYKGGQNVAKVSHESEDNQIALATQDVAINNLGVEEKVEIDAIREGLTEALAQSSEEYDNPWEVAQVANPNITKNNLQQAKNTAIDKEIDDQDRVPYKMQKNILIPIPEGLNNRDLTPQFSSSSENKKLEDDLRRKHGLPTIEEQEEEEKKRVAVSTDEKTQGKSKDVRNDKMKKDDANIDVSDDDILDNKENLEEDSETLTKSIAAWFKNTRKKNPDAISVKSKVSTEKQKNSREKLNNENKENSIFKRLLGLRADKDSNILPTELKLSFQPNRAEISGQTLEWLRAFSDNVVENEDVIIEIRIDRSAPYELQQKRLKLLYRILANNGVEYNKINIIFTDREPNSFIIRNVRLATEEEKNVKAARLGDNPW